MSASSDLDYPSADCPSEAQVRKVLATLSNEELMALCNPYLQLGEFLSHSATQRAPHSLRAHFSKRGKRNELAQELVISTQWLWQFSHLGDDSSEPQRTGSSPAPKPSASREPELLPEQEPDAQITREWLLRLTSEVGSGPAKLALLGLSCRYGKSARVWTSKDDLLAAIEQAQTSRESAQQHQTADGQTTSEANVRDGGVQTTKRGQPEGTSTGVPDPQVEHTGAFSNPPIHTDLEAALADALVHTRTLRTEAPIALRAAADAIEAGKPVGRGDTDIAVTWSNVRSTLIDLTLQVSNGIETGSDFDAELVAETWLAERESQRQRAAEEQAQAERAKQANIQFLTDQRDKIEQWLADAKSGGVAYALRYEELLAAVCDDLRKLEGASSEPSQATQVQESPQDATSEKSVTSLPSSQAAVPPVTGQDSKPLDNESVAKAAQTTSDTDQAAPETEAVVPHGTDAGDAPVRTTTKAVETARSDKGTQQAGDATDSVPTSDRGEISPSTVAPSAPPTVDHSVGLVTQVATNVSCAAAYWTAQAAALSKPTLDALKLGSIAFACGPGGVPAEQVAASDAAAIDAANFVDDPSAATMCAASLARIGLASGWLPNIRVVDDLIEIARTNAQEHELLVTALEAMTAHHSVLPSEVGSSEHSLAKLADRADDWAIRLPKRTARYQGATQVLRALAARTGELGASLALVRPLSEGNVTSWEQVREELLACNNDRDLDELIDRADARVRNGARNKQIVGAARQQLRTIIREVIEFLREVDAAYMQRVSVKDLTKDAFEQRLLAAAQIVLDAPGESLESAIVGRLAKWLQNPETVEVTFGTEDGLSAAPLPAWFVPRDANNQPFDLQKVGPKKVSRALLYPEPLEQLASRYFGLGNGALGTLCLSLAGGDPAPADGIPDRLRSKRMGRMQALRRELDMLRALPGAIDDGTAARVEQLYVDAEGAAEDRIDVALRRADDLGNILAELSNAESARIGSDFDALEDSDDATRQRVLSALESGNLLAAQDMLDLLRRGDSLATTDMSANEPLHRLVELMAQVATSASGAPDLTAQQASDHAGGIDPDNPRVGPALHAWKRFETGRLLDRKESPEDNIRDLLRLLGINPTSEPKDISPRGSRTGARQFSVAIDRDSQALVPDLGTWCDVLHITTVMEHGRTPDQLANALPQDSHESAHLLLTPGGLSLSQRRRILSLCRARGLKALVIDSIVMGLMAAQYPGSFRDFQRMTLPFSVFPVYVPHVAGNVPREVFVGRREELNAIMSKGGSTFVYGGRQLGKSALLRKAQREFGSVPSQLAIYIDLKAHGVGTYRESDHLWDLVGSELADRIPGIGRYRKDESVRKAILKWLEEDQSRRMLLLLDEADLYLDSEAREGPDARPGDRFRSLGMLKSIMEDTDRRFKVVFAGLHQVQRFQDISNTPIAHGGRNILVGPLRQDEALQLLAPLSDLGYLWENPLLQLRLLSFANYQANLVQIVCEALVRRVSGKPLAQGEPPLLITEEDIQALLANATVRSEVAERFQLTVNLEDRYRVIAWAAAVDVASEARSRLSPEQLLEHCLAYWPDGFDGLSLRNFERYLREMEGLGVFFFDSDQRLITFRSPHVVRMLGPADVIERELYDLSADFDLPKDFNPRDARRSLKGSAHAGRSPLTEEQLGRLLLPLDAPGSRFKAVVGSTALGVSGVPLALQSMAKTRDWLVSEFRRSSDAVNFLEEDAATRRGAKGHLIVLVTDKASADSSKLLQHGRKLADLGYSVVAILGPDAVGLTSNFEPTEVEPLVKWSDESLRSWEHEFDQRHLRRDLLAVTGGWSSLIEDALVRVRGGDSAAAALAEEQVLIEGAGGAEFLRAVGAGSGHRRALTRTWVEFAMDNEGLEYIMEACAEEGIPTAEIQTLIAELMWLQVLTSDGASGLVAQPRWQLDPVVATAIVGAGDRDPA